MPWVHIKNLRRATNSMGSETDFITDALPPEFVVIALVGALFVFISTMVSRYKRCPPDKILVVYGNSGNASIRCIHGGGAFVFPIIQNYAYLDLTPLSIEVNLTNAPSRQDIPVDVNCHFTIAISSDSDTMRIAAERLLGLSFSDIQKLAKDILFDQLRLVIATMTKEEINSCSGKFLDSVRQKTDYELKKIGLKLIKVKFIRN